MSIRSLWLCGLLLVSISVSAALIPGESLFLSPQVLSFEVSPEEQYTIRVLDDTEKYYLIMTELETLQSKPLFYLDKQPGAFVEQVRWISDTLVYIRYHLDETSMRHLFVYLVPQEEGLPEVEVKPIAAYGYIIDPLPDDPEHMLFAHESRADLNDKRLYHATMEQIIEGRFATARRFAKPLSNAIAYYPGQFGYELMARVVNAEEEHELWMLDKASGKWQRLYSLEGENHTFVPVGFLDANTLAVLTNRDSDLVTLRKYHVDTQTLGDIIFQHPSYDLVDARLADNGAYVEWVSYLDHGQLTTQYLAFQSQVLDALMREVWPNEQIALVSGVGTRWQIVKVFDADKPGAYYVIDLRTMEARPFSLDYPELVDYQLAPTEVLTVDVEDGERVEALLTRPVVNDNRVLLVYPHGGPVGVRDEVRYDPTVQYLANRGYTVLQVNFRGSAGFGREFMEAGAGQFGRLIEQDITAVVQHVRKRYSFDSMCSIGLSYGGYSALMLAVQYPGDYQCVVSMFGVYDLPLLFNYVNYFRMDDVRREIARVVGDQDESLKAYSLFHRADEIKTPLLLIAGTDDRVAGFEQANRLRYRLRHLGADYETLFYEGVGHGHSSWYWSRHQMYSIDAFLRRRLQLPSLETPENHAVLAQEYLVRADVLFKGEKIEAQKDEALALYQKAIDLGSAEAMSRMAGLYARADHVERDRAKAYALYRTASDSGLGEASYDLADLIRRGVFSDAPQEEAWRLYQLAQSQGYEYAPLALARAQCLGQGTEQNFDECLMKLQLPDSHSENYTWTRRGVLSDIYLDGDWSEEQEAALYPLLEEAYDVATLKARIMFDRYGAYNFSSGFWGGYSFDRSDSVVATEGQRFGVRLRPRASIDKDNPRSNLLFKVHWQHPPVEDQWGILRTEETLLFSAPLHAGRNLLFRMVNESYLQEGEWRLRLLTLDDELLREKVFQTVLPE